MKQYFEILGLEDGASQQQIHAAYKRLSKELNPEKNNNELFFIEEYKKVKEAFEALSNSSILVTEKGAQINMSENKSSQKKIIPNREEPVLKNQNTFFSKKLLVGVVTVIIILITVIFTIKNIYSPNPVYLDENGITIKAQKWAKIGDQGYIDDVLYTIVDKDSLLMMIEKGHFLNKVCTSLITDMSELFNGKTAFNQDISNWDVSNVNNMNGMFRNAESFNQPIDIWNVSNVTQMKEMFNGAYSFNQPIGSWNVSKVNSMEAMFSGGIKKDDFNALIIKNPISGSNFNQDISSWNVSNVKNMDLMFAMASSFNQDISNWDVHNVTTMSSMFFHASSFNQDLSSWDVTNVKYTNSSNISYSSISNFGYHASFAQGTPNWTLPKPNFIFN